MSERVRDHLKTAAGAARSEAENHQQKIRAEQEGKRAPPGVVHVKSSWGEEEVYVASGNHFGVVHGAGRGGAGGGVYVRRHAVFNPAAGICAGVHADGGREGNAAEGREVRPAPGSFLRGIALNNQNAFDVLSRRVRVFLRIQRDDVPDRRSAETLVGAASEGNRLHLTLYTMKSLCWPPSC